MEPSPRVRGKLSGDLFQHRRIGTIPACTGKTASACSFAYLSWNHPRVYGENLPILYERGTV